MASRYLINPAVDNPSELLAPADSRHELLQSLTSITKSYPPQPAYSSHECHGLYSGPTSIAYLFLHLSSTHPDLQVSGHKPLHWAEAYLAGKRSSGAVTADRNGIINEKLAFYAVRSALTQDIEDAEQLAEAVKKGALTAERGSDEFLYGRAGCLYLLRLVGHWVPESGKIVKPVIENLIHVILSHGPPWPWHGKDYLGKFVREVISLLVDLLSWSVNKHD